MTSIDGPRTDVNDITTLSYYECATGGACGQLQRVTNALGHTTTYDSYDGNGRVLQTTDANGTRTNIAYDARGRVTATTITAPSGGARLTRYTYNAASNVTSMTSPDGIVLTYTYDAAQKLRQITDNQGNKVIYHYDLKGNRTQEGTYDPDGTLVRAIETSYDLRNRVSAINHGGSLSQQVSDAIGNLTHETAPNQVAAGSGIGTAHSYDALNRLLETVDAVSGMTAYGYDVNDRLTHAKAPTNATTQYLYDDLGNLLQELSPDRGPTTYTYDEAGNVRTITDARRITASYIYDALNRVTNIDYPGTGEDIAFAYDTCVNGSGRLCRVVDASGTTDHAFDAFGNITEQQKTKLGIVYATKYTYDAGNRITAITFSGNALAVYGRDVLGRLTAAATTVNGAPQTLLTNRTYRADGLVTGQTYSNGIAETRRYNLKGELIEQFVGNVDTRLYGYDPNGNLTQKQSLPEAGTYTYDALDRHTQTARDGVTEGYGYDANGNRLSDVAGRYVYAANSNRLLQTPRGSVTLDAAGNTLTDGNRTFTYNAIGHLKEAYVNDTRVGTYTYNFQRQRTRKVVNGRTTVYHYGLDGELLVETDERGTLLKRYVYADGVPIAQVDTVMRSGRPMPERVPRERLPANATTERLVFLHTDHLGTPRLATDASQTVRWRWEGEAFGGTPPNEDTDGDGQKTTINIGWRGTYRDKETGLYLNGARYFDAKSWRFLTPDPMSAARHVRKWKATMGMPSQPPLEINSYVRVANNPLRWSDPTGMAITGNVGVCAGGQAYLFVGGSSGTCVMTGTDGKVCTYHYLCLRIGAGAFIGGGSSVTGGISGGTDQLGGWSAGIGGEVGAGVSGSVGVQVGPGGISGSVSAPPLPSAGLGIGAGIDICITKLIGCECGK